MTIRAQIAFDLSLTAGVNFFTLDDVDKGVLDNTEYVLGGDTLIDVTQYLRSVQIDRGRSRTLEKFTAGQCNIELDNRSRIFDPTFGPGTWIGREQGKLANLDTTPKKYVASLYWAVTTFATVGYGDFFPVTVAESLWTMGYMLFNVALTAFIVGTITLLVVRRDARTSSYRERSQSLRSFAAVNQLPEGLKASMQEHLRLSFANEDIADERVLGELTEDYLSFFF